MSQSRGIDIRTARRKLGLSIEGLRRLLRMGENSGKTIRRWQSGEQDVPGPVAAFLEVLMKSAEARRFAGVEELSAEYPAFRPGRPAVDDDE